MREYFTPQRSVFPSYLTVESGRIIVPLVPPFFALLLIYWAIFSVDFTVLPLFIPSGVIK